VTKARVLVTRSEPGASETAERLSAAGYLPIVEPVFTIEALPAEIPEFDALAFTSANGARQFASLSRAATFPSSASARGPQRKRARPVFQASRRPMVMPTPLPL
jgi:uroporphyrinogen-III synthase